MEVTDEKGPPDLAGNTSVGIDQTVEARLVREAGQVVCRASGIVGIPAVGGICAFLDFGGARHSDGAHPSDARENGRHFQETIRNRKARK